MTSFDDAFRLLTAAGIESPRREARMLWEAAQGTRHEAQGTLFQTLLTRRLAREPMSQILGRKAFWSLDFLVNSHTLTPRPDSEIVIETALAYLTDKPLSSPRLLDLGTGTGCLLLSLLAEIPAATGLGIDRSDEALAIARQNAANSGLTSRVEFHLGNWAEGLTERFDMVVSNPPYIPSHDIAGLEPEVRDWEPHLALDGGADGLDAYRAIASALPSLLTPGGAAVLEIGIGQASDVIALNQAHGLTHRETRRDLGGIERSLLFTL